MGWRLCVCRVVRPDSLVDKDGSLKEVKHAGSASIITVLLLHNSPTYHFFLRVCLSCIASNRQFVGSERHICNPFPGASVPRRTGVVQLQRAGLGNVNAESQQLSPLYPSPPRRRRRPPRSRLPPACPKCRCSRGSSLATALFSTNAGFSSSVDKIRTQSNRACCSAAVYYKWGKMLSEAGGGSRQSRDSSRHSLPARCGAVSNCQLVGVAGSGLRAEHGRREPPCTATRNAVTMGGSDSTCVAPCRRLPLLYE